MLKQGGEAHYSTACYRLIHQRDPKSRLTVLSVGSTGDLVGNGRHTRSVPSRIDESRVVAVGTVRLAVVGGRSSDISSESTVCTISTCPTMSLRRLTGVPAALTNAGLKRGLSSLPKPKQTTSGGDLCVGVHGMLDLSWEVAVARAAVGAGTARSVVLSAERIEAASNDTVPSGLLELARPDRTCAFAVGRGGEDRTGEGKDSQEEGGDGEVHDV